MFYVPWYTDKVAPKMAQRPVMNDLRSMPGLEVPDHKSLKRARLDSMDLSLATQARPVKKQRVDSGAVQSSPRIRAQLPAKFECDRTLAQASSSAVVTSGASQNTSSGALTGVTDSTLVNDEILRAKATHAEETLANGCSMITPILGLQSVTPLQQVIENEFNMQILLKHNELRLIEQELAKCQTALEQLRRCELRPYPGHDHPSLSVSAGTGAAMTPAPGYTRPLHPPPHGVTDGPYSRHYQQWLLRDPHFDSAPVRSVVHQHEASAHAANRATRHAATAKKAAQKQPVISGKAPAVLQSLPNYPTTTSSPKGSPLVLRRSTDGVLVKLICNNCLRGNFSSIQGFLNHCRIAHKVDYKSHDMAAVDCGRPLDDLELANLAPETLNAPPHKPSASRASSAVSTPYKNMNLVHPLNHTGAPIRQTSFVAHKAAAPKRSRAGIPKLLPSVPSKPDSTPFQPSSQAPHLSAYLAKHGLGGNLDQAITTAKQRVDLGAEEYSLSPDAPELSPTFPVAGARMPSGTSRAGSLAPPGGISRPPSRKGHREPTGSQRHRPSPLVPLPAPPITARHGNHVEIPESPQDRSMNLSPHTADSNPGLVSDHEDEDEHGSGSEEDDETPPHPSAQAAAHPFGMRRPTCADDMDVDVIVDDEMGEHGVVIRRNSMVRAGSPSRK